MNFNQLIHKVYANSIWGVKDRNNELEDETRALSYRVNFLEKDNIMLRKLVGELAFQHPLKELTEPIKPIKNVILGIDIDEI